MKKASDFSELISVKDANIDLIALGAMNDTSIIPKLIENLKSRDDTVRYNSFMAISRLCETHAEIMFSCWDDFTDMLSAPSSYQRNIALTVLSHLVQVDCRDRFSSIIQDYLSHIKDEKFITSRYCIQNLVRIVRIKPVYLDIICNRIFREIEFLPYPDSQKQLLYGDITDFFDQVFDDIDVKYRDNIVALVRELMASESPKARDNAKKFLARHYPDLPPGNS